MPTRREDSPEVRILLRIVLGFSGGFFISVCLYVALWLSFDPRREAPTEMGAIVGLLLGGISVAYGAFARNCVVRVVAWAIAGAGFGELALACLIGGHEVGTVLTQRGMVMALVAAVLGYRTVPPQNEPESPSSYRHAMPCWG